MTAISLLLLPPSRQAGSPSSAPPPPAFRNQMFGWRIRQRGHACQGSRTDTHYKKRTSNFVSVAAPLFFLRSPSPLSKLSHAASPASFCFIRIYSTSVQLGRPADRPAEAGLGGRDGQQCRGRFSNLPSFLPCSCAIMRRGTSPSRPSNIQYTV